jgi:hypothetical protein
MNGVKSMKHEHNIVAVMKMVHKGVKILQSSVNIVTILIVKKNPFGTKTAKIAVIRCDHLPLTIVYLSLKITI